VVWLTILSSAPGEQGYHDRERRERLLGEGSAAPTAALLDPTGQIGHLYDAKTSPQMVVINPQGVVIYDGAIDANRPPTWRTCLARRITLNLALEQALAGKQVRKRPLRVLRLFGKVRGLRALKERLLVTRAKHYSCSQRDMGSTFVARRAGM